MSIYVICTTAYMYCTCVYACMYCCVSFQVRMYTAVDSLNSAITRSYPEIMGSAGWGILCYSEQPVVSIIVGEVICRQTQSLFLSKISRGGHPAGYSGHAFYNGTITCTGDENKLSECSVELAPSGWCPGKYTIIDCTMGKMWRMNGYS